MNYGELLTGVLGVGLGSGRLIDRRLTVSTDLGFRGLDSRYMISQLKPSNVKVLSLTTVATPHQGNVMELFLLSMPCTVLYVQAMLNDYYIVFQMMLERCTRLTYNFRLSICGLYAQSDRP